MNDVVVQNNLHILFDGRSTDISLDELDVGTLSTDEQIRTAVARYLGAPRAKLDIFAVRRHEQTGSLTLHPEAAFG